MAYTIEALMADAVTTVETVAAFKSVSYPPPPTWPAFGPFAYLDYGGCEIEQGSDEVTTHTILIHVLMPMRGDFAATAGEYAAVLTNARAAHRAFYTNVVIAGEAALASPGAISKPEIVEYSGVRCVRATLTLQCVTAEDVGSLVSD